MQRRIGRQERAQLLEALYDLHNRCALAMLRAETHAALRLQFVELLRQVDRTTEAVRELKPWPPLLYRRR